MALNLDFWQILDKINTQYPQFIPILTKPGVFDILTQAINDDINWPKARIDAEIRKTPYMRDTPAQRRQFDALLLQDPATAAQKIRETTTVVNDMMRQTGIQLDRGSGGWDTLASDHYKFVMDAAANGWSPDEIKSQLTTYNTFAGLASGGGGEIGTNAAAAKRMADDYGVPLSDTAAKQWGVDLTRGTVDTNALSGYMMQQAKSMYPGINEMLDRGFTVRQIADPYLQIAQQELGVDPKTIQLSDPKWNKALNTVDPKTGSRVSMSLSDWTAAVRSDPLYGYDKTIQGRQRGAQFATQLSQMMGAVG